MAQRVNVFYADRDDARSHKVADLLLAHGFRVTAVTAGSPLPASGEVPIPDVVLVCDRLEPQLHGLIATLWPHAPVLVLTNAEDYHHLVQRLRVVSADGNIR